LTSNDDAGKLEFIGYINGTPSLDGGISYTLRMEIIAGPIKQATMFMQQAFVNY
jgi:hypothetical protein